MTSRFAHSEYDCIIIGGGPAGATAATVLADHGRRTLLLERDAFPRHHIGESLIPQTYWTFKRIGMLEKLEASSFVRKQSVQFVSASGKDSLPYYFTDRDPNEWSITWQVVRDEFDRMMLDNAREHGAEVHEGVSARSVKFDGDRAVGVVLSDQQGGGEISAGVVVDASGSSTLLAGQLDLRRPDAMLQNASIYGYYRGAERDSGRNAGATLVVQIPGGKGWVWFIPLPGDVAGIGVVAPPSYLFAGRNQTPEETLAHELAITPGIARRIDNATRIDQVRVCRDFTYHAERIAGHGWVLTGDAFGFLDPVYSSGVMLALKSGEWAADAVHDALSAGDVSAQRLGRFGPRFMAGMELLRKLVYAYYDPSFHFGEFMKAHPEHRDHLVRLLIGDVFEPDVARIFDAMRTWTTFPAPMKLEGSAAAP